MGTTDEGHWGGGAQSVYRGVLHARVILCGFCPHPHHLAERFVGGLVVVGLAVLAEAVEVAQ